MLLFRDFHQLAVQVHEGKPLPFLKEDTLDFLEDQAAGASLRATINATYSGYLLNRRVYPGRYLRQKDCFGDWCSEANGGTATFDKPVLTHHDDHGEPIGRVVASKFIQLWDDAKLLEDFKSPATHYDQGSGLIQVQALITDPVAIAKILDGRYNTVSSGQNSPHMWCSICGSDFKSEESCEHFPGRNYEDDDGRARLCYVITGKLTYHELSYVNLPANQNAVTVAAELNDSLGDDVKAEHVDHDQALTYAGMVLVDKEGSEIDLSNKDGEDLPPTKTQIQVSSEIDLDKLQEPAPVDLTEDLAILPDDTFAIGNTVRALDQAGLLEDGPMSGMISYFKTIVKRSGTVKHQHILYLELDLGARRLRGGTEYTDKGESHFHSVDLEVADLNAKVFKGETRDADRGDHHVHDFEFDMMEDHAPQVSIADALAAARLVDKYLRAGQLTKAQQTILITDDAEEEKLLDENIADARKKKLRGSMFCGPNRSFPVPDCAHATAARRLIGRAKLSSDAKARVLASVNRRAKALKCGTGKDETDDLLYGMLTRKHEETTMDPKDKTKTEAPKPAEKSLRDQLAGLKDDALLDKAVELSESVESKDRQIVTLTEEKQGLADKNESLEASSKELTDENTELREKLHKAKARELAVMRLVTGQLEVDSDEKFEEAVSELAERTEDSLGDAVKDAMPAFQKALAEREKNPSGFLTEKGEEKPPVDKNGDPTNDNEAKDKLQSKEKKSPEARKAERVKDL